MRESYHARVQSLNDEGRMSLSTPMLYWTMIGCVFGCVS